MVDFISKEEVDALDVGALLLSITGEASLSESMVTYDDWVAAMDEMVIAEKAVKRTLMPIAERNLMERLRDDMESLGREIALLTARRNTTRDILDLLIWLNSRDAAPHPLPDAP